MKPVHLKGVQETLARALELDLFLWATGKATDPALPYHFARPVFPRRSVCARLTQPRKPTKQKKANLDGFKAMCWGCGETGHKQHQCRWERKSRLLDELHRSTFQPCCWKCGKLGHMSSASSPRLLYKWETIPGWVQGPPSQQHSC